MCRKVEYSQQHVGHPPSGGFWQQSSTCFTGLETSSEWTGAVEMNEQLPEFHLGITRQIAVGPLLQNGRCSDFITTITRYRGPV